MASEPSVVRGWQLEETFGVCLWQNRSDYLPYELAMLLVEENQPWSPTSPTTALAKLLHRSVRTNLNRSGVVVVNDSHVQVFTAIGTPLDIRHGVDGYVVVREDPHHYPREFVVTFDLTTFEDRKNEDELKADLILQPDHFKEKPVVECQAGFLVAKQLLKLRRLPSIWRPVLGFGGRIGEKRRKSGSRPVRHI